MKLIILRLFASWWVIILFWVLLVPWYYVMARGVDMQLFKDATRELWNRGTNR